MVAHPPVELEAEPHHLLALASGILSYGRDGRHYVSAVWLCTSSRSFLVTAVSHDVVFKFEVFPLAISTPHETLAALRRNRPAMQSKLKEAGAGDWVAQMPAIPDHLPPPEHLVAWPLREWRLDVLRRLDWIASAYPEDWFDLGPGDVPPGTQHSCMVATGLLFTDTTGHRVLIAADNFPLSLIVTEEPEAIDQYLKPCFVVPVEQYVQAL